VLGPITQNCQEPRRRAKNCPHGDFNTWPASPLYRQFSVSSLGSTTAFPCLRPSNPIGPKNNPHAMPKSDNVMRLERQSSRSPRPLVFPNSALIRSSLIRKRNTEVQRDDVLRMAHRPVRRKKTHHHDNLPSGGISYPPIRRMLITCAF
jgi:hypothetical protein